MTPQLKNTKKRKAAEGQSAARNTTNITRRGKRTSTGKRSQSARRKTPRRKLPVGFPDEAVFTYVNTEGEPVAQKRRDGKHPKGRWFVRGNERWFASGSKRPDGTKRKLPAELRRLPYRLDDLQRSAQNGSRTLTIADGEPDVDRLWEIGEPATCAPHGCKSWKAEHTQLVLSLGFKWIRIVADRDDSSNGYKGQGAAVEVLRLFTEQGAKKAAVFEAVTGKDIRDHLDNGYGIQDLRLADINAHPYATSGHMEFAHRHWERLDQSGRELFGSKWKPVPRDDIGTNFKHPCFKHGPDKRSATGDPQAYTAYVNGKPLYNCFKCVPPGSSKEDHDAYVEAVRQVVGMSKSDFYGYDTDSGGDSEEQLYRKQKTFHRANRRALDDLRREEAAKQWTPPPSHLTLTEDLAIEDGPIVWSVESLHQRGDNTLLAALYKVGKTTLFVNLLRALVDGEPLLGKFKVNRQKGRVAVWNYELSERRFKEWLRDIGIKNTDEACVYNLRGFRYPLWTPYAEDEAVRWLETREVTSWIIDPFRKAYAGFGDENENTKITEFTDRLDVIKKRAGVVDLFISHHMPRAEQQEGEERGRGGAALDDWCDVRWLLTRGKKEDRETRYFYADGRDVSVDEYKLREDPATRRLTIAGGSRTDEKTKRWVSSAITAVNEKPGMNLTQLRSAMKGVRKEDRPAGIADAIRLGLVRTEQKGNATLHYPVPQEKIRTLKPRRKRRQRPGAR